jgi:hypothetical protein
MTFISVLFAASAAVALPAELVLDNVRPVADPRNLNFRDPINGDRGVLSRARWPIKPR